MKFPLDLTPYSRDPRSCPASEKMQDGLYVYVQDLDSIVYVMPDGPHLHPKVLGGAKAALYAGDLTVRQGVVRDLTNLSGTFQFDSPQGLLEVAVQLQRQGLTIAAGAVRFFTWDGCQPPIVLK